MDAAKLALGLALLLAGAALAADGARRAATEPAYDPTVDRAVGDVHVLARGTEPMRVPVELHRGSSYAFYDRTFTLERKPDDVVAVDFGVWVALAPQGSVPFPFSPSELPAKESWSGAHVAASPWKPPFGEGVTGFEAVHTFRAVGDTWRARLALDTERLPPGEAFDHVLGSWYVAHRADGTSTDVLGIAGAGEDHVLVVREDEPLARASQRVGLPVGALAAAAGFALAAWAGLRQR